MWDNPSYQPLPKGATRPYAYDELGPGWPSPTSLPTQPFGVRDNVDEMGSPIGSPADNSNAEYSPHGYPPYEGAVWSDFYQAWIAGPTTPQHDGPPQPTTPPAGGASDANKALWDQMGHDPQRFVQAYIAAHGLVGAQSNPSALTELVGVLNALGIPAKLDQRQDAYHKGLYLYGTPESFVKMLDGSDRWIWDPSTGGASSSGGSANLASLSMPGLLDPFTGQPPPGWTPPEGTTGLPTPFQYAPFGKTFAAPTSAEAFDDPGYQFGLTQGERALEQSAAGRGTLRTGGTLKNILDYGRAAANTQYGDVYNRRASEFDRERSMYDTGFGEAKQSYDTNLNSRNLEFEKAWKQYLAGHDIFHTNQDSAYNKLYGLSSLGITANQ